MATMSIGQIKAALVEFSATTRLMDLRIGRASSPALLVEAFAAEEALQEAGRWDVIALSTSPHIPPASLLGQLATLALGLAGITDFRWHDLRPRFGQLADPERHALV